MVSLVKLMHAVHKIAATLLLDGGDSTDTLYSSLTRQNQRVPFDGQLASVFHIDGQSHKQKEG